MLLARRTLIASAAGALAFAPWMGRARAQVAPVASDQTANALFRELSLAFYRDDYVLTTDPGGEVKRSDFLRGPNGRIAWLRDGGRLFAKQE